MAYKNVKTYTLSGKVEKVFAPRPVKTPYGTKTVSNMLLALDNGAKVKICFWDIDISHHEDSVVTVSGLSYKDKYNDVPQYSSTKTTKIESEGGYEELEAIPPGATPDAKPEFGEPEEVTKEVAEKIFRGEEDVPSNPKVVAEAVHKVFAVSPQAIEETVALASVAVDIAEKKAPEIVKGDANAFQALFATIFINLSTRDYYIKNPKSGK